MEFYKIVAHEAGCRLEAEGGQVGLTLDQACLCRLAQLLYDCYQQQDRLPLRFRRYLTAYYSSGQMEYVALAEAQSLSQKPELDGFATTWLEEDEENRVWIGADGVVENRGPSGEKVKFVLELLLQAFCDKQKQIELKKDTETHDEKNFDNCRF